MEPEPLQLDEDVGGAMRKVELKFSDQRAREIEYFLRQKYGARDSTSIESLIELAIAYAVSEQATAEADIAMQNYEATSIGAGSPI